jgi:hypothetical protein
MNRDPVVYISLSLDTNLEVTYSTTHLFDEKGEIIRTRTCHGDQYPLPYDELGECLEWGGEQLAGYFAGDFNDFVG